MLNPNIEVLGISDLLCVFYSDPGGPKVYLRLQMVTFPIRLPSAKLLLRALLVFDSLPAADCQDL